MKCILYLSLLFTVSISSQNTIEANLIKSTTLNVESIVDIDDFGTQYYILNNTFYKKEQNTTLSYSNIQLGQITSASAFNILKPNVFYKDFNTVIILDNRLAEIYRIDFNDRQPYRNVSHISAGNDNTLWILNQDISQLELYDYKANKIRATTIPIESDVLDIKSDYNNCWLLTERFLYKFNYFGSVIQKIKNEGFTQIDQNNENLVLLKENALYYFSKDTEKFIPISTPKLLINQFLLTNETLYIYHNEILNEFQLKTN